MPWSIRAMTLLALNAFVVGVAVILGWVAQNVAGRIVEERFAKEMVGSVAGFLKDKPYPMSNSMMGYLRDMFNAEWLAVDVDDSNILVASLPLSSIREFHQLVNRSETSGLVRFGGTEYRFDSQSVRVRSNPNGRLAPASYRLYMLVPFAQFQAARSRAVSQVWKMVWPAAGAATILGLLLALATTRPIRKLGREMDRLALIESPSACPEGEGTRRDLLDRGPTETRRLAASFYGLLDRLSAARRHLARQERLAALGRICLSVAHELRNPLSGIKMNVRVLQDRVAPSDAPLVEPILREIDRMGLYIEELMSLAPASGPSARAPALAPVRLSELAQSVLTILEGRCRHARIEVRREYPADEPQASADANQLRQVMMNFMVNAIEAMPVGGTMTVAVRPGPSSVRFCVADTGKGVQAAGMDIFDAFATDKPNGVGLGLYLARQIVTRHAGRIGYDNTPAGAVFWFELAKAGPREPSG